MDFRLAAAERWTLFALVCLVSVCVVTSQRTYMRTCECEPQSNGFCAFTLLLPEAANGAASTCPTQAPGDVSMVTDGGMTSLTEVEERLDALETNVTSLSQSVATLTSNAVENAVMLAQLQGRSMQLSDRLTALESALTNMTSPHDDVSNDTASRVQELSELMQEVNNTLTDVIAALENVGTEFASLSLQVENVAMTSEQTREELGDAIENLRENVTSRTDELARKIDMMTSCARRSLLVDGNDARIDDADVTASSEASDATAAMVRIRNSGSAWCSDGKQTNDESNAGKP